ncbi:hypothetical protein Clacol_002898 [Clathrus columnatus]|uniref:Uncharacterized protein n=1 Tax=Clathrus columnatus TaxID=1419009 RepID=A0AAV5A7F6_9AGAM|nr:hypothetical protein Clacol_002898 [Clathrus columnatus]
MSRILSDYAEVTKLSPTLHNDSSSGNYQKNNTTLSEEILGLQKLYKKHIKDDERFSQERREFEQRCAEIQNQTEEDLSHTAALLIQINEVEQMTDTVLAHINVDKVVVTQVRQEIVSGSLESMS